MTSWIVVEDEPDLYDMILAMYQTMGVNGVAFPSGEDALDWIDAVDEGHYSGEMPEMALIDIRLPGDASGVEVSSRLRQSKVLGHLTIVLMTAYRLSPREEARVKKQSGADLLMYKPLPVVKEFQARIQAAVSR